MSNVVDVLIRGIDGVSPVVNGIKSNVLAGFGMGVGMKALDGMLSGVGQLKSQLTEALSLQSQYISGAAGFGALSGISFSRSTEYLKELRLELGKVAADLPGTTQDYLNLANTINGTLLKGYDVSDAVGLDTFKKDIIDITKRSTLLGRSRGAASEDTAYYMKQFLSENNSLMSLNPLAFDNRAPEFIDKTRQVLAEMGKSEKDFNKMATGERARILRTVLGKLTSDEMISALQGTAESIIEGWKDKLFSQDRGVLGFMREVQSRAGRSALDSFTELLNRVNSLAGTAGKVLSQLGLTFDPMEAVIDFISWLSNIVSTLEGAIVTARNPGEIIPNIFREMWGVVGGMLDNLTSAFYNLDMESITSNIGNTIKSFLFNIPWGKIGVTLGTVLSQVALFLANVLGEVVLDPAVWGSLLKGLLQLITGFLVGIGAVFARQATRDWDNFVKGIVGWFKDMWTKVKDAFEPIASLITKVVSTIVGIFNKIANFNPVASVSAAVAQSPIGQAVGGVVETVKASPIGQAVGGIINKVTGKDATKPGDNKPTIPVAPGTTPLPQTSVTNNKQASNTFAPVVNVAMGTGDNIADKVIGALEQMYSQAQQGQMA